jgi:hypothetical protein
MNEPSGLHVLDKNKLRPGQKGGGVRSAMRSGRFAGRPLCSTSGHRLRSRAVREAPRDELFRLRGERLSPCAPSRAAPEPHPHHDADRREEMQLPTAPAEVFLRLGANEDFDGLNVTEHLWSQNNCFEDLSTVNSSLPDPASDRPRLKVEAGGGRHARVQDPLGRVACCSGIGIASRNSPGEDYSRICCYDGESSLFQFCRRQY